MKESVKRALEVFVGGDNRFSSRSESSKLFFPRNVRTQSLARDALIEYARSLALDRIAEVSGKGSRELFLAFAHHCQQLSDAHAKLNEAAVERDLLTPGAEWLLDNYHIIQEQITSIARDFPKGYDKTLPKLLSGNYQGYPRVYELALEFLAKSDSVVDITPLSSFISGYQSICHLTLGELWAVPIMLRFALIKNICSLAQRFVDVREERKQAEAFVDEIIGDEARAGTEILLVLAEKLREEPDLLYSSAPYLIRRLRERGRRATITLQWLEERLREEGVEPEELLRAEQFALAADQISIGNSVTSLKSIGFIDWNAWVESVSLVSQTLSRDEVFRRSDFKTRDRCRHTIERIAKRSGLSEKDVADKVVDLAQGADRSDPRRSTVCFYLLDRRGISQLKSALGADGIAIDRLQQVIRANALGIYLGGIGALVLIILYLLLPQGLWWGPLAVVGFLLAIAASEFSVNIIQWLVTRLLPPAFLPKLDYKDGIPHRTAVVVHALFGDVESVAQTIEGLEVRYLANPDPNAVFGVLADLRDSDTEVQENDSKIIRYAQERVATLTECYGPRFFIMFRNRRFNPSEGRFMAWERKRGKIEQFNELLLDPSKLQDFIVEPAHLGILSGIKYVVTLDNDSQLPRGSLQRLVGVASHPLNKPVLDRDTGRVVDGYGIIQPRVGTTLTSAYSSEFARIFSGHAGLDPYSETVSEVYQDIFGEGSFVGKGLYDVEAFSLALKYRVPENSLLSHDLFEGNFARVGLATDICLFDDYPSKYHVHTRRHHRWVRGDWQLLPWLGSKVPLADGSYAPNQISALGRWKIFDNLRRSLVAPALFLLLLSAWLLLPNATPIVTFALLVITFPVVVNIAQAFVIPPRTTASFQSHIKGVGRDIFVMSKRAVFTLAVLPHQTAVMLDAITRTLYRIFISRKHLLEWEPAAAADRRLRVELGSFLREMQGGLILTIASGVVLAIVKRDVFLWHLPFFALWLSSPWFAFKLSSSSPDVRPELTVGQRQYLRGIAADTWRYFKELHTERYNYLIPDNIQLVPSEIVATRTSPTNISLSLLSSISAYELGFASPLTVLERISRTIHAVTKLERFRGHLFNWYDCERMAPLSPRYISSVDSGNFVGHLIAVRAFLRGLSDRPLLHSGHLDYLLTNISISEEDISSLPGIISFAKKLSEFGSSHELSDAVQLLSPLFECSDLADTAPTLGNLRDVMNQAGCGTERIDSLLATAAELVNTISSLIEEHDFRFLYDSERELFSIGYHVDQARRDSSFYDLLASEARLTGLVCIALGQVPQKHWFALGRALTESSGGPILLSWSGTMFEYLMPVITTKDFPGTLLSESYRAAVRAQKNYGARRGVPWGISESSFSGVDFEKTYQYRAFGVPGLGLKRGLEEDLVISPYSTALALLVAPDDAIDNFRALEREGARGRYGFFEAIDYTPSRLSSNEKKHLVQNFFAHHQGMSLCSMANVLANSCIQELFHSESIIKATELLLQERFPDRLATVSTPYAKPEELEREEGEEGVTNSVIFDTPHTPFPRTHLISNGALSAMVDNSGGGYLVLDREFFLTRWREDLVVNKLGTYIYLRDRDSGHFWSATFQPTCVEPDSYEVHFSPDKAEFKRKDRNIFSHSEIVISPEDNVEIRKVSLVNLSGQKRHIEITSYGEVVMNSLRGDIAHPAFSKMFIQSEYLPEYDCLLFARRPRSRKEPTQFFFHMLTMRLVWERVDYDSSRYSFIGRGRDLSDPQALHGALGQKTGSVLDPIFSLRTGVEIEPGGAESLNFISGYASTREEAVQLIRRYKELHQIARAYELAWSQASVELRNEQMSAKLFPVFQKLGSALLFNIHPLRASADLIQRNKLAQQNLWRFGISGDLPIAVARITEPGQVKLVQELLAAHHYLRARGLSFDLVILNEYPGGYLQTLQEELDYLIRSSLSGSLVDRSGGVFLRSLTQVSEEERDLLQKVARVVLNGAQGNLAQQLKFEERPLNYPPVKRPYGTVAVRPNKPSFELDNGYGGFTDFGRAYAMYVGDKFPPLPYSNVIASPHFGFLVTESGGGYVWSDNSRENRLTPWSNDPVIDPVSEVIYLYDQTSGEYWSLTPRPAPGRSEYRVVHRFGESEFATETADIASELRLSIAQEQKIKFSSVTLRNRSKRSKQLHLFYYAELVCGVQREEMARYQSVSFDPAAQALFTQNSYNADFPGRVVVIGSSMELTGYTASRAEFVGRNRTLSSPQALDSAEPISLKRKLGGGFDTCSVVHVTVEIPPGGESELFFFLGEFPSVELARQSISRLREGLSVDKEVERFKGSLKELTEALEVSTPSRSFDLILNGWLIYQVLSSRLFGRTGFYQSGGAFGYRDQLQDVLALLYSKPELTRSQLLLHASRQFPEGDVQHWWHPPTGKGVRTKISDDFLWLPLVAARYIEATRDHSILDEVVSFIEGPILGEHEHEMYIVPRPSEQSSSFYDHCLRALENGLKFGVHGLPLMGVGDWNDGMNEVGKEGKGESVWLALFTALCIREFLPLVREPDRAARYESIVNDLVGAVEAHCWDGGWYRRAYFDDSTPLGSQLNDECQIDSLPQSWSVLAGFGSEERQRTAMNAVYNRLVDEELQLIKLFDPPFDKGSLQPGYIKGYLPGVRENGGQYTHAAVWVVMAAAKLGDGDRAFKYFQFINPVNHGDSKERADVYMGEPYVLCGDVYAAPPFEGRAGWSWYTGSAGWLYQAGITSILGFELHTDGFELKPCIPQEWPEYRITYRRGKTVYEIVVKNPQRRSIGPVSIKVDGNPVDGHRVYFMEKEKVVVEAVIG
jgi:cellobiose phosphorylase